MVALLKKRLNKSAAIGVFLGGPLGAVIATSLTMKKISETASNTKTVNVGKTIVSNNADKKVSELTDKSSNRTESQRVADIKSRLTGKKENGKPAFLMNESERDDFSNKYQTHRKKLVDQYRKSTNTSTKQKIQRQLDRMENDYLSIVEQDFWYSDD